MPIITEDRVWAGSETSLQAACQAEEGISAKIVAGCVEDDDEEDRPPRLLSIDNGLATVTIKGPLVNSDSWMLEFFGLTGYPEIRDALLAAANDASVTQILLDVDSGGGAVSGVADVAALIRTINDKVKPVTTYTDGVMASAAYWLGGSAGKVYAGKSAMVGSIGVIATFAEYSKRNEMEGVTVTVLRAGKEKALANSNEKLTPKAEAQIQAMVDASYQVFVEHVAEMRGVSYPVADKKMADGQEFIGKAALDVGLIDGITTFDALVSDLRAEILVYQENLMHNRGNGGKPSVGRAETSTSGGPDMAREALSAQAIAALASGAAPAVVAPVAAQEAPAHAVVDAAAAAAIAATPDAAVEAPASEASASVVEPQAQTQDPAVQLLTAQLKEKDSALLQAGITVARLEEKIADLQATHEPLREIAAASINNMRIALNHSALDLSSMSAAAVVNEHTTLSEQFKAEFKAGGVAAVSGEASVSQPMVDPRHLARVSGAGFQRK